MCKINRKFKRTDVDALSVPHAPTHPPFSTTHFHTIPFLSFGRSTRILYSCFLFHLLTNTNTHLTILHTLPPVPLCHHLHHHFSGNVIEKSLGTSKHLHLLFEVKFLILFDRPKMNQSIVMN